MNFFGATRFDRPVAPPIASTKSTSKAKPSSQPAKSAPSKARTGKAADALFALASDEEEDEDEAEDESAAAAAARSHVGAKRKREDAAAEPPRGRSTGGSAESVPSADPPGVGRKKPRNAPEELTSKRQVKSGVIVTSLPSFNVERKRRDPRFDPLCGDYDPNHFHAHYGWMTDEKQKEMQEWQRELKSGKRQKRALTEEEREELHDNIQRAKQSLAQTTRDKGEQGLLREWKHNERLAQKDGKKPFFLKESEKKKLALASRYLELKENKGALQKFMEKKTKKIKNADHKYMPREGREE